MREGPAALRRVVAVVGSINLDLRFSGVHAPGAGETRDGATFDELLGGKGANQASAVVGAGAEAFMIARAGNDEAAGVVRRLLREQGVDDTFVSSSLTRPTGRAAVLVDPEGENRIVVANGANDELDARAVADALDEMSAAGSAPAVVAISAEVPQAACAAALRWAADRRARSVFNVAPARSLSLAEQEARPLVVVNRGEAFALTGLGRPEHAVRRLSQMTSNAAVVTDGRDGSYVLADGRVRHLEAERVVAVDTTGAGDTYCGTLAAHLAAGDDVVEAARAASAAAARHVVSGRVPR